MALSRVARKLSAPTLSEFDVYWRRTWPKAAAKVVAMNGGQGNAVIDFQTLLASCDLVAVSGAGQMTDSFGAYSTLILNTLEAAIERGIPTVVLGQGIGPIEDPVFYARAASVLPRVDMICLRENVTGPALLKKLGVADEKVVVTGDDTVPLAYAQRPDRLGNAVGVNLRICWYSHMSNDVVSLLRPPLQQAAADLGAPFVSVPISRHPEERDQEVFNQLTEGYPRVLAPVNDPTLIEGVMGEIGRCRAVVTTSYHAGVFSLSQGVSIVGWIKSTYYSAKLRGLANQFGVGCNIVSLDEGNDAPRRLHEAILTTWESAPTVRPQLLDAAARQVEAGEAAYARLPHLVKRKAAALSKSDLLARTSGN
jgi:polysaccharide pyruvyl transferase WcaK-like protein